MMVGSPLLPLGCDVDAVDVIVVERWEVVISFSVLVTQAPHHPPRVTIQLLFTMFDIARSKPDMMLVGKAERRIIL